MVLTYFSVMAGVATDVLTLLPLVSDW
jgi:hypothetical protein